MLPSAEIKRQIIENARDSVRKRESHQMPEGLTEDKVVEIGKALETMSKMGGWIHLEAVMFKKADLVNMTIQGNTSELQRGVAKGYLEIIDYVARMIAEKDKILDRERLKYEAKNVQKNQEKQGE